jgi:hypothetical protein
MRIQFDFIQGPMSLEIELLDNPAVQEWAKRFVGTDLKLRSNFFDNLYVRAWDPVYVQQCLDKLYVDLEELASLGFPYNGVMPTCLDEITRTWTNHLHRYFTHTLWDVTEQFGYHAADRIKDLLHDVNIYVHEIEDHYPNEAEDLAVDGIPEIYLSSEPSYKENIWWTIPDDYRQYHSKEYADVIMGSQIQGKTLLRNYLDGDNPNDRDTTGHWVAAGALRIMTTDARQRIYESAGFNNWLQRWGVESSAAYYDFPLGNIVNKNLLPLIIKTFSHDHQKGRSHITASYLE